MNLKEILVILDEVNDSYEDIYNTAIHELSDQKSEELTVKEFLLEKLKEYE